MFLGTGFSSSDITAQTTSIGYKSKLNVRNICFHLMNKRVFGSLNSIGTYMWGLPLGSLFLVKP
jgi:hypothetical protein